jgi:hypothetical protein
MSDPIDRDPLDPAPTPQEEAEAEELRAALDDPARAHDDAELARALGAAFAPRDLPESAHRALVERALAPLDARRRMRRRRQWSWGAVAALAAGVCGVIGMGRSGGVAGWKGGGPGGDHDYQGTKGSETVALRRSTQSLFAEPFAASGGQTSRIDRIAVARAADLRENEFARWGVR